MRSWILAIAALTVLELVVIAGQRIAPAPPPAQMVLLYTTEPLQCPVDKRYMVAMFVEGNGAKTIIDGGPIKSRTYWACEP
jgi:hypothetical protein